MKMNSVYFRIVGIILIISIVACSGDEEVSGCMDSSALNYNAEATIAGSCDYIRDQYIGDYSIETNNCNRQEEFLDDLNTGITPNDNNSSRVNLIITGLFSQSLIFEGEVSNSGITFVNSSDDAFVSLPADALVYNNTVYMFPIFELNGMLNKEGNILSGRLTLAATDADNNDVGIFSLICDYRLTGPN